MAKNIVKRPLSVKELRQLVCAFREECNPIWSEMSRVMNMSIRPMFMRGGKIEYGEYPQHAKKHLAELQAVIDAIAERYKKEWPK